jgi:hypothetical protein
MAAALAGLLTRLLLAAALLLLTGLLPAAAVLFARTRIVLLLLVGLRLVGIGHAGSSRIKRPCQTNARNPIKLRGEKFHPALISCRLRVAIAADCCRN